MEEKKKIKVEIFGIERFLDAQYADGDPIDAISRFSAENELTFTIDGKRYKRWDFAKSDLEDIDEDVIAAEFFAKSGGEIGMLYTNKAWCEFDIEVGADEEFDKNKASIVIKNFIYPNGNSEAMLCALIYDGQVYYCGPRDSIGKAGEKIWPVPKYGYIDKTGKYVIEPKFDKTWGFADGRAVVRINGKYGVINTTGAFVIEPKYEDLISCKGGFSVVKENGKWGILDKAGVCVFEPKSTEYGYYSDSHWAKFFVDGKYFFITFEDNEMLVNESEDEILGYFEEGMAKIKVNGKWGFIDTTKTIIVEPKFENVTIFSEGLAGAKINGKWGYINKSGVFVIEPKFEDVKSFSEGLAGAKINGKWGYINKSGVFVIEPKFDETEYFSDNMARVCIGNKWGLIDSTGKFIFKPKYAYRFSIEYRYDDMISIKGRKYIFIDRSGKQIPGKFDDVGDFNDGIAPVKIDNKWGYINKEGVFVIEPKFDKAEKIIDGVAFVNIEGKFGLIDKTGGWIVEPKFESIWNFEDGIVKVKLNDKWGYIDKTRAYIIEPKFESAYMFQDGLALVKTNGKFGYIDEEQNFVIEPKYDDAKSFCEGVAAVLEKGSEY